MKKNKKADVSVSFSWVLMLIIGVFFITISYNIIDKYTTNENIKTNIIFSSSLQNIFNKIGRTSGIEKESLHLIEELLNQKKIELICNNNDSILSIDGNLNAQNDYMKIYPTFINKLDIKQTDETYLLVENFNMPFKITNMMAITTNKNLIIFDKDSIIGQKLYNKFKKGSYSKLNYQILDKNNIKTIYQEFIENKNLNSVTIVTDNKNTFTITDKEKIPNLQILKIDETSKTFKFNNQDKEYSYYDQDESFAIITMAIFSNEESFECSYNKLNNIIYETYNFYKIKAKKYSELETSICDELSITLQKSIYKKFKSKLTIESTGNYIKDEITNINTIKKLNTNLKSQTNCPYLY